MLRLFKLKKWTSALVALIMTLSIMTPGLSITARAEDSNTVNLQILATSDSHGRFKPYDYATDAIVDTVGLSKVATVVKQAKAQNPNTIVVDNGDTIQDNSSQIFFDNEIHPMILAMNEIGYDVAVLGNHEFNYGVDTMKNVYSKFNGEVLAGNIYKPDKTNLENAYTIVEKNGVKIGIIGMTNPNITKWDAANLAGYTTTSPIIETRKAIEALKSQVDVMIGVMHLGPTQEYGNDDGADVVAAACPELAAIVAGHAHLKLAENRVNGVVIIEPSRYADNVAKIDIKVTKNAEGKYVIANRATDVKPSLIAIDKTIAEDPQLAAKLEPYHQEALTNARTVIGKLEGGDLVPADEVKGIPTSQIQETPMIKLINDVQMHYAEADVSAAAAFSTTANIKEGDITKAGTSKIYMYDNTLYKLEVTGSQLKKYMEWSAKYYNTYKAGDLTVSFNETIRGYNYDMFAGVKYEVDISKAPGSRIVNLTKMDGTPIGDNEKLTLAVNNYRANSQLLAPGIIYEAGDMPKLLEKDIMGDVGGVRELIGKYIQDEKDGTIRPELNNNWKIIGNNWNSDQRAKAVRLINEGKITVPTSTDGRTPNVRSVTWPEVTRVVDVAKVDMLSFNDFHGTLKLDGKNIGAAKLSAAVKAAKAANPNTVLVTAGDLYQGSAMSNLTYGEPVSKMLKEMGSVASAVGNHEFDWGTEWIGQWAKDGGFDFLASNIYSKTTGKPVTWAKPYKVIEQNGIKIGLIGIATPETEFKTKPENVKDLVFKNPVEAANEWASYLKNTEHVDFVVALTHLGSMQDATTKVITGEVVDFTKDARGVDAVISAHTHMSVSGYANNIPVVQAYYNGRSLAKLSIGLNVEGKLIAIPSVDELYKRVDTLPEDPVVKAMYQEYETRLQPILGEVLGKTDKELSHDKTKGVSLLGEWSCDVMNKVAGTQIAMTNGGGLRRSVPAGDITMGIMYEVMPFDNTLVKMELSGADIKKNIDHGINNTEVGWVQFSGMKVYYDPTAAEGSRITSMRLLDGTKIEMDKYYTVVTNDFMATGGDKYDFKNAKNMVDMQIPIREALVQEIRNVKNLSVNYVDYLIAGEDTTVDNNVNEPVKNDPVKIIEAVNKPEVKAVIVETTTNSVVAKAVFEAIKGQDKTITFKGDGVEWTFNGKDIENPMELDLSLVEPTKEIEDAINAKVKDYDALIISFKHDGSLGLKDGAKATVRIKLDSEWLKGKDTKNIYIYYYNETTNKAPKVAGPLVVDKDGYVQFEIDHCSDYFIADKDLVAAGILPKTGSVVDITGLVGFGATSMLLGGAFIIVESRRRKKVA